MATGKIMSEKELREFVKKIGRAELYEEIELRKTICNSEQKLLMSVGYTNAPKFTELRNVRKYPAYLKAVRVTLMALGYDQEWVESVVDKRLINKYIKKR